MRWALIFALALAAGAGAAEGVTSTAVRDVSAPEMEVYAAYLDQNFKPAKKDGSQARGVILLENEAKDLWQKNRRAWEIFLTQRITGPGRASADCLRAFWQRPQQVLRFFSFPATRHALRLVRSDELQKKLAQGWDELYKAYPGAQGYLSFGAIAFGSEGYEALFTVQSRCGKKCGYRDVVYMQKVNGKWLTIIKEALP